MVEGTVAKRRREATIRHLYKPERPRAAWLRHEAALVNVTRKLKEDEKVLVYLYAERLALERITKRLERNRRTLREEGRHD